MALVVLAVFSLAIFLLRQEENRLQNAAVQRLTTEALQMAAITPLGPNGPAWTPEMESLANIGGYRLTLIAADGRVVGDSQHDPSVMENHSNRVEVRQALTGETGTSRRYSQTIGTDLLYAAVPLRSGGRVVGIVRTAETASEIAAELGRIRAGFIGGALIAAVLSLIFGMAVSRRITRPLRDLEKTAGLLGSGRFDARVRVFGQDELGMLAQAFNKMARRLDRLVTNLSEEKGKLLTILAALSDGVIVFDQHQRVILANEAAGSLLGLEPDKMTERTPAELLLPPAAVALIAGAAGDNAGREGEIELHLPVRRLLAVTLTPIRDEELRLHGTLAVLRDVTALRHLERVRQDFVANVSHELRTPLTSIKAMAETLQREDLDPGRRGRFLSSINSECDRLNALVSDLLTLTSLDNGAAKPSEEVFPLDVLIGETIAGLFPGGAPRRPSVDIPAKLPRVKADPDQIRQVLINLLDNAVKHTPAGTPFGIRAEYDADRVTVTVWDRGPGIPPNERERIFERFYRLDKARSRAMGGTGLGLSIVKHLVEQYGGRVWVEDCDGACFRFTIPRA